MKIAIDIRPLLNKYHSGVQEYIINLLPNIFEIDNKNQYLLFSSGSSNKITNENFANIIKEYKNVKRQHLWLPNKILNRLFQLKIYALDNFLERPDLFFLPNISYFYLKKTPYVVTFHDLSFEYFPEFYSWDRKIFHFLTRPKKIAQKADKIIAVSNSTKQDLIDLYHIAPEKISVIYSGINSRYEPQNRLKTYDLRFKRLPEKFILYLGTIEPRKNIENIIKGFEMLKNYPDLFLVIAGPKGWKYDEVLKAAKRSLKKDKIIFFGPVSPKQRFYLYQKAKVFLWPSYFEGFGFPPLEAAIQNTPIIASNNSSLPEILEKNAVLIDAYRPEEIAIALEQILENKDIGKILKTEHQKFKKFSWQKCAQETLKVLTSMKKNI